MLSANNLLPDIWVPAFEIKVGGTQLPTEIAKTILEISVKEVLNHSSSFSFQLNDPTLEFIEKESGLFTEGQRVEISIGYLGKMKKMILGEITALTADFPSSGPATLQVEGFD